MSDARLPMSTHEARLYLAALLSHMSKCAECKRLGICGPCHEATAIANARLGAEVSR